MNSANFGNIVGRDVWFCKFASGDKNTYGKIIAADLGDDGIRVYIEDTVLGTVWQQDLDSVKFNRLEPDEEYP